MSAYTFPIKSAVLLFPVLAFIMALPLLIKEYRKYGSFPLIKSFIVYSFMFYLLCAYFLVILPLPPKEDVAQLTTAKIQLQPFANVGRFLAETVLNIKDPSTYLPALKQGVVLEPLFNIFLTVPFGLYLRYYFKFSFKKTVLFSFCLSLFFELTQLSGLYFIYPRPYRLADVDDLINNTLGGVIGFILAPLAEKIFPDREEIDDLSYEKGQKVTLTRRLVAFFMDWTLIQVLTFIIGLFLPNKLRESFFYQISSEVLQVFLYFMVLPVLLKGATFGKKLVKIKILKDNGEKAGFRDFFKRYFWLYGLTLLLSWGGRYFNQQFNLNNTNEKFSQLTTVYLGLFAFFFIMQFILLVVLGIERLSKHPFYYERLSKTKEVNAIQR